MLLTPLPKDVNHEYLLSVHTGRAFTGLDKFLTENTIVSFCTFAGKLVNMVDTYTIILTRVTRAFVNIILTQVSLVTCKQQNNYNLI